MELHGSCSSEGTLTETCRQVDTEVELAGSCSSALLDSGQDSTVGLTYGKETVVVDIMSWGPFKEAAGLATSRT
jgi:hypothetical protein